MIRLQDISYMFHHCRWLAKWRFVAKKEIDLDGRYRPRPRQHLARPTPYSRVALASTPIFKISTITKSLNNFTQTGQMLRSVILHIHWSTRILLNESMCERVLSMRHKSSPLSLYSRIIPQLLSDLSRLQQMPHTSLARYMKSEVKPIVRSVTKSLLRANTYLSR